MIADAVSDSKDNHGLDNEMDTSSFNESNVMYVISSDFYQSKDKCELTPKRVKSTRVPTFSVVRAGCMYVSCMGGAVAGCLLIWFNVMYVSCSAGSSTYKNDHFNCRRQERIR